MTIKPCTTCGDEVDFELDVACSTCGTRVPALTCRFCNQRFAEDEKNALVSKQVGEICGNCSQLSMYDAHNQKRNFFHRFVKAIENL